MQDGSDAVARGARVVRLDRTFRWPGGRYLAVVLNVAYEVWSDGKASGIGPMGNPLPAGAFDTNALSWGSYGATCGIERLLRVLDRAKRSASVMVTTIRNLAGFRVFADKVTGSKEVRAEPFAAQVQGGNVKLVAGAWHYGLLDEMESFPSGKYRDQVDACSGAFNRLTLGFTLSRGTEPWPVMRFCVAPPPTRA